MCQVLHCYTKECWEIYPKKTSCFMVVTIYLYAKFRHIKSWPLHCLHPILTVVLSHVLLKVHVPTVTARKGNHDVKVEGTQLILRSDFSCDPKPQMTAIRSEAYLARTESSSLFQLSNIFTEFVCPSPLKNGGITVTQPLHSFTATLVTAGNCWPKDRKSWTWPHPLAKVDRWIHPSPNE